METKAIKHIRTIFVALVTTIIIAAMLFSHYLPALSNNINGNTRYLMELISVASVIFVIPIAIKAFDSQLHKVKKRENIIKRYSLLSIIRLTALATTIIINIAFYYIMQNISPLYCALMSGVAMLYCFPTKSNLNTYLESISEPPTQTK